MTAPEKLWACIGSKGWYAACCSDEPFMDGTDAEYTRSDLAQAAVAAAYEAAAQVAASHAKYTRVAIAEATAKAIVENLVSVTQTKTANAIEDAIRALATPDQIAALAAERAATVTVNPLVWECVSWASGDVVKGENDDTWEAETPFNDTPFVIEWRGADKFVLTMPNGETHYSGSLEAAKAKFQTIHEAAIRSAITITSEDAEITRLRAVIAKDAAQMIEGQHKMHKAVEALREVIDFACALNNVAAGQNPEQLDRWSAALTTLQERMK